MPSDTSHWSFTVFICYDFSSEHHEVKTVKVPSACDVSLLRSEIAKACFNGTASIPPEEMIFLKGETSTSILYVAEGEELHRNIEALVDTWTRSKTGLRVLEVGDFPNGPEPFTSGLPQVIDLIVTQQETVREKDALEWRWAHKMNGWVLEKLDDEWHRLYKYWRKRNYDEFVKSGQDVVTLLLEARGDIDRTKRLSSITPNCIFVREIYKTLVRTLVQKQKDFPRTGVVLCGQPGSGKTTWLFYLLICLFMKGEDVLFRYKGKTYLFFGGRLYTPCSPTTVLPEYSEADRIAGRQIWSLIDSDETSVEPPTGITMGNDVFPVQVSSPNATCYRQWSKARGARVWGMTLWSKEELKKGIKLHDEYDKLIRQHKITFSPKKASEGAPVAAAVGAPSNIDVMEQCRSVRDVVRKWRGVLENIAMFRTEEEFLDKILDDAILHFGEVPRDVYTAVFRGPWQLHQDIDHAMQNINNNLDLLMRHLSQIGTEQSMTAMDTPFHRLFAVSPVNFFCDTRDDPFLPAFKSPRIEERMMGMLRFLQARHATKFVNLFSFFPEGSGFAGWVFKSLVHYYLMRGSDLTISTMGQGEKLTYTKEGKPLNYVFKRDLSSASEVVRFRNRGIHILSGDPIDVWEKPLMNGYLCVPQHANNPLFDALCVDYRMREEWGNDEDLVDVTVWVVQATISTEHYGSPAGYALIRAFVRVATEGAQAYGQAKRADLDREHSINILYQAGRRRLGRLTEEEGNLPTAFRTKVQVKYLLVCRTPEPSGKDEQIRTWFLPVTGWFGTTPDMMATCHCAVVNVNEMGKDVVFNPEAATMLT